MVRRPPTRSSILIAAGLAAALVLWTWLSFTAEPLIALDQRLVAPALDPGSATTQIAAAFALLTWPGLTYAALVGIALWAFQRRLRQLCVALLLTVVFGWGLTQLMKFTLQRTRPPQSLDLLTSTGYAYPSSHMCSVVAGAIAVGATFAVTRQTVRAQAVW